MEKLPKKIQKKLKNIDQHKFNELFAKVEQLIKENKISSDLVSHIISSCKTSEDINQVLTLLIEEAYKKDSKKEEKKEEKKELTRDEKRALLRKKIKAMRDKRSRNKK